MELEAVDVVVIGAGQAGLSAAYHLRRRGYVPYGRAAHGEDTFVVLDAEERPGGAWQHRWASLRMATVNGIHELPGFPVPPADPRASSRDILPAYFAEYEERYALEVVRPVRVRAVRREDEDPDGRLIVETDAATWAASHLINATGTWSRPFWPHYPGQERFRGRQLHVADHVSRDEFAGKRVVVVGAGISAVQLLDEISRVTETTWVTRREPAWRDEDFTPELGRAAVALVEDRVRRGLPPGSVVSVTGLPVTPAIRAARERGALDRLPMFDEITETGVRWPDGTTLDVDVILWCTGFRSSLDHLAPLGLRNPGGGITMTGKLATQVSADPRVHLVGYGPSASTIGANRAGRAAARELVDHLAATAPGP